MEQRKERKTGMRGIQGEERDTENRWREREMSERESVFTQFMFLFS